MMQAPESRPPRRSSRPSSQRPEAGILVEDTGRIRKVLLDRPSRKNAIDRAMYLTLTTALQEAAISERIDVVLIASSGGAFSAGSDPGEAPATPGAEGEAFAQAVGGFVRTLASFPKPIVAAVGGVAVGLGATILLHCDLVVAAHTAAFEFPRVRLPVEPEGGIERPSWRLASACSALPSGCSSAIASTSTLRLRFGLVNTIVQREELASASLARAEALARLPQSVVRETKRLLREPLRAAVDEAVSRELEVISRSSPPPPVVASSL